MASGQKLDAPHRDPDTLQYVPGVFMCDLIDDNAELIMYV